MIVARSFDAKHFIEFDANELRAMDFSLVQTKFAKKKSVVQLYAREQDSLVELTIKILRF